MVNKILLVEPEFPVIKKSKNHKRFIPLGLLKLASYHRSLGDGIELVRGWKELDYIPDKILITSLFTYWSDYVWEAVQKYKNGFPDIPITVGGIYATLMPEHCKKSGCDEVFIGVHKEAEQFQPAYDLIDTNFQIVHTSRGCTRNCSFCGVWRIEPEFISKTSISDEIQKNRILFYDNNLLANPNIENILEETKNTRVNGKVVVCESQCGLDGRLLTPKLAKLLKESRLINPRIAWDHKFSQFSQIEKQISILVDGGYKAKNIYVFMVYNYDISFNEMEEKRQKCIDWGVQIADCRFRPLNQTFDNYNPHAWKYGQTEEDYHIHQGWTDGLIRKFRKNVREQNIVIRHGFAYYSREKELAGRSY